MNEALAALEQGNKNLFLQLYIHFHVEKREIGMAWGKPKELRISFKKGIKKYLPRN